MLGQSMQDNVGSLIINERWIFTSAGTSAAGMLSFVKAIAVGQGRRRCCEVFRSERPDPAFPPVSNV